MEYQKLYSQYQHAVKLRELNCDNNFKLLKEIFEEKILSSISLTAKNDIIPYLSGIKEVFEYVENEANSLNLYRDELDKMFADGIQEVEEKI
jgi:hypothetical protein